MARFNLNIVLVAGVLIMNACYVTLAATQFKLNRARVHRPGNAETTHDSAHEYTTHKPLQLELYDPHYVETHALYNVAAHEQFNHEARERPHMEAYNLLNMGTLQREMTHDHPHGENNNPINGAHQPPQEEIHEPLHVEAHKPLTWGTIEPPHFEIQMGKHDPLRDNEDLEVNITQTPISHGSDHHCPTGYQNIGSECFFFSNRKADWNTARIKCETMGAKLAYVTDFHALKDYVIKHFQKSIFWLGGYIPANEDDFVWVSGEKISKDIPWGPFNPSGNKQMCLSVGYDEAYDDDWCCRPRQYVCSA